MHTPRIPRRRVTTPHEPRFLEDHPEIKWQTLVRGMIGGVAVDVQGCGPKAEDNPYTCLHAVKVFSAGVTRDVMKCLSESDQSVLSPTSGLS